jgi:hypothetical protein
MSHSTSRSVFDAFAHRSRDVIYWIATLLAALAFVVPGVLNLVRAPHMVQDMAHLGYPPYFPTILGAWKVLGALAIVLPGRPRLKEWAYAGMVFDLTGAAISRAVIGDGALMILVPLVIAAIVGTSWALRPAPRRLAAVYA